MADAILITPVKNSWETTLQTIEAVSRSTGSFEYYVFNDFSTLETKQNLIHAKIKFGFELIHLEDITSTPSPNYKLVLETAQRMAIGKKIPLIVVESDVIVQPNTIQRLIGLSKSISTPGLIGAITVDRDGNYNFPYNHVKTKNDEVIKTNRSISFCCTLICTDLLKSFDFSELSNKKDWFDVFLSRKSIKLGFNNYLAKGLPVLHLPHSSRPWKQLKYSNPILYYLKKYTQKRDRI